MSRIFSHDNHAEKVALANAIYNGCNGLEVTPSKIVAMTNKLHNHTKK